MAITWGEWVRVGDANRSYSHAGTLRAYVMNPTEPYPWLYSTPTTGFGTVSVSTAGCTAAIVHWSTWSLDALGNWGPAKPPDDPSSDHDLYDLLTSLESGWSPTTPQDYRLVWVYKLTVTAGVVLPGDGHDSDEAYIAAWGDVTFTGPGIPPAEEWTWGSAVAEVSANFVLTVQNCVIKRRKGVELPQLGGGGDARPEWYWRDAHVEDRWFQTPGTVYLSSLGAASATETRRNQFPGQPDADIGDGLLPDPYIGMGMSRAGPSIAGTVAQVVVNGGAFATPGPWFWHTVDGASETAAYVKATSDTTLSLICDGTSSTGAWSGTRYAPMDWVWDSEFRWFHDDEVAALADEMWAGFYNTSTGALIKGLLAPDGIPLFASSGGWVTGQSQPQAVRGNRNQQQRVGEILCDGDYLRTNLNDPSIPGDSEADQEEQHDRGVQLWCPGVNQGLIGGVPYTVATATRRQPSILPLVERVDLSPRWVGSDGVACAGTDEQTWTIAPGTTAGQVAATLQTRYWARLNSIPPPTMSGIWHAPWYTRSQAAGAQFWGAAEPSYAEDVYGWAAHGYLSVVVSKGETVGLELTLVVAYSTVEVNDPWYTCGGERAEEWGATRTQHTATYTVSLPAGTNGRVVDLMLPAEGPEPHLFVVDSLTWTGFSNTGEEPVEVTLNTLQPIDQGTDLQEAKHGEPWDIYRRDAEFAQWRVAGNWRVVELPSEPIWGGIPEDGHGQLEGMEHCPTNPVAGLLHYARPLTQIGILEYGEGYDVTDPTAAGEAMTRNTWKGAGNPEILCAPLYYWVEGSGLRRDDSVADSSHLGVLQTTIPAASWNIARGVTYTLAPRYRPRGAFRDLLTNGDGTARLTPATVPAGLVYVLWRSYTYYTADGEVRDTPTGLPTAGQWVTYGTGAVPARLSEQGIWTTPALHPTETRLPAPAATDDYAAVVYMLQLWTSGDWAGYDANDPAEFAAMQEDAQFVSLRYINTVRSRRWASSTSAVPSPTGQCGGNLVRHRSGRECVVRYNASGQLIGYVRGAWRRAWREGTALHPDETLTMAPLYIVDPWVVAKNALPYGEVATRLGDVWEDADGWRSDSVVPVRRLHYAAAPQTMTCVVYADADHYAAAVGRNGGTLWFVSTEGVETVIETGIVRDPLLLRYPDGTLEVLLFASDFVRRWLATDGRGETWAEQDQQELSGADLRMATTWTATPGRMRKLLGLGVECAVAGYHPGSGQQRVFYRGGRGKQFRGPYLEETAGGVSGPYIEFGQNGYSEVGWLVGSTWHRWTARHPELTWTEV